MNVFSRKELIERDSKICPVRFPLNAESGETIVDPTDIRNASVGADDRRRRNRRCLDHAQKATVRLCRRER